MSHPHSACSAPPMDGVDPLSFAVFGAFMRSIHLHRQLMTRLLAQKDSHPGQVFCLQMLAAHDGISQRDLAQRMHLSRPTVTTMLQRMEKAGSIVRRPDEADQRLTRVHLTDAGRALEAEMRVLFAEYIHAAFDPMTAKDREDLERLLGTVAENTARALL